MSEDDLLLAMPSSPARSSAKPSQTAAMSDLSERLRELDADAATHNAAATLLALTDLLPEIIAALDAQPVGLDMRESVAKAVSIIEDADRRAEVADGPVLHVRDVMTDAEWRSLYGTLRAALASEPQP